MVSKQGYQTYPFDKTGESRQKTISRLGNSCGYMGWGLEKLGKRVGGLTKR